jgi:XTP/dITP diphosphohydrolase
VTRTLVVVPAHRPGAVPAAAVPALRAASTVHADASVPDAVLAELGAVRWAPGEPFEVLVSTDRSAAEADAVVAEPAGSGLLDAVAVMDRLRSPGGCPWDAEQTHASLLQYLVEECYELYQAIEDGDRPAMREELGDVLLQVLFHARVAAEDPADPFDVDDVAGDLVAKLVGRHPHVFAGSTGSREKVDTAERQEHRWEELKRAEKQRGSSLDGVPLGQPAVALAAKLTSRTARAGLPADLLPVGSGPTVEQLLNRSDLSLEVLGVGEQLFALAAAAKLAGIDPEAELRGTARRFADAVRAAEKAAVAAGADPHALDAEGWRSHWPS